MSAKRIKNGQIAVHVLPQVRCLSLSFVRCATTFEKNFLRLDPSCVAVYYPCVCALIIASGSTCDAYQVIGSTRPLPGFMNESQRHNENFYSFYDWKNQ